MKILTQFILFIVFSSFSLAGEALGVKYDELYIARLKHPQKSLKKDNRLLLSDDFAKQVLSSYKVKDRLHTRFDKLFSISNSYDNGLGDSRLQLYALLFYKDGKPVLSIAPNLTGGDLYATDKKGYSSRSLSSKQRSQFLDLVFICLSMGDKSTTLPNQKANKTQ